MKISLFHGTEVYQTQFVDEIVEVNPATIGQLICKVSWSPFIFSSSKDDQKPHRTRKNFISTSLLVFDIDEGLSIAEAKGKLEGWQYVLAPTKSHQKEKLSGQTRKPACDRFRVILFLESEITDPAIYQATWLSFSKVLGVVDEQCKDTARFYFPCTEVYENQQGKLVTIVTSFESKLEKANNTTPIKKTDMRHRGQLFRSTIDFISNGSSVGWHTELLKAAIDLKEQGFSINEAIVLLRKSTENYQGDLDAHDIAVIEDVYQNRGGRFEFRKYNKSSLITELETFKPPSEEQLSSLYDEETKRVRRAQKESMTFISPALDKHFRITSGITAIGAKTASGKTTCANNIVVSYLKENNFQKKILYITNEESYCEVYSKIVCARLNFNWKTQYWHGDDEEIKIQVDAGVKELQKYVTVVSSSTGNHDTTNLEVIKGILEHANTESQKYGLIVLDYLQTVSHSNNPNIKSQYEVSKNLGQYLKKYAQDCFLPVIVFCQLYGETNDRVAFADRVQGDRQFANHCHTLIEVIPDMETRTTKFRCHKHRWGDTQNWEVVLKFDNGRLRVI